MKLILKSIPIVLSLLILGGCSSDDDSDIDTEKPTISVNYNGGFPQACAQLQRGQTYTFRAKATDNNALASYSLDIHNNFDHHTHDDQGAQCELEAKKEAVNPMLFMENYPIANGPSDYDIQITITVPNEVDTGDYHCAYSVTDATGWQSRTSIDIKIVE